MEFSTPETILKLVSKHLLIRYDSVFFLYNEIIEETKKLRHKASGFHKTDISIPELTDIKHYLLTGFERHKTFIDAELHNKFLLAEINYFNPECIITFGKNVYDALSSILKTNNLNIKVHYLIQPSQRTQGIIAYTQTVICDFKNTITTDL